MTGPHFGIHNGRNNRRNDKVYEFCKSSMYHAFSHNRAEKKATGNKTEAGPRTNDNVSPCNEK